MHPAHQQRIEDLESAIAKTYTTAATVADFRRQQAHRAVLKEQLAEAEREAQQARTPEIRHG